MPVKAALIMSDDPAAASWTWESTVPPRLLQIIRETLPDRIKPCDLDCRIIARELLREDDAYPRYSSFTATSRNLTPDARARVRFLTSSVLARSLALSISLLAQTGPHCSTAFSVRRLRCSDSPSCARLRRSRRTDLSFDFDFDIRSTLPSR